VSVADAHLQRHRKTLVSFIEKNPNATRSDVMQNLLGTYDFLITRDKAWFQATVPMVVRKGTTMRSRRYDPKELDESLASRLRETAAKMLNTDHKPKQVTETALLRRHGALGRYSAKRVDFPSTARALLEVVESADQFLLRKVTWAIRELISAEEEITFDNLRRKANIAPPRLRPHLVKIRCLVSDLGGTVSKKSKLSE